MTNKLLAILTFLLLTVTTAYSQQARNLQVNAQQITTAYAAIMRAQSDAQLERLKETITAAIGVLNVAPPTNISETERTLFLQYRGELAKLIIASFQNASTSQVELSQLVDTFLRANNQIEIALSVTTIAQTSFGFTTQRENRERAVSFVRILTNSANGATDIIDKLISLIESSQSDAVAVLNQLSDLISKVQAQQ